MQATPDTQRRASLRSSCCFPSCPRSPARTPHLLALVGERPQPRRGVRGALRRVGHGLGRRHQRRQHGRVCEQVALGLGREAQVAQQAQRSGGQGCLLLVQGRLRQRRPRRACAGVAGVRIGDHDADDDVQQAGGDGRAQQHALALGERRQVGQHLGPGRLRYWADWGEGGGGGERTGRKSGAWSRGWGADDTLCACMPACLVRTCSSAAWRCRSLPAPPLLPCCLDAAGPRSLAMSTRALWQAGRKAAGDLMSSCAPSSLAVRCSSTPTARRKVDCSRRGPCRG